MLNKSREKSGLCSLYSAFSRAKIITLSLIFAIQPLVYAKPLSVIQPPTLEEMSVQSFLLTHNIQSIEEYSVWLKENIEYKSDSDLDTWSTPLETLRRGYGDCEDMAFLSAEVLKHFGYQYKILAAGRASFAHVFTIFVKNGQLHVFDNNTYYINPKVNSLADIFAVLHNRKQIDYLVEVRISPEKKKQMRVLYAKKLPPKHVNL